MTEPTNTELIRALADSERRYAQLAAFVTGLSNAEGAEMIARHSREVGMSDWHEKFIAPLIAVQTTP